MNELINRLISVGKFKSTFNFSHISKNKELRKQVLLQKESHFLFLISPQILCFSIESCIQNCMLYLQSCFISYNDLFIRNLKFSLVLSIFSNVNMVINCYECPLLSTSARSVCCYKVLQQSVCEESYYLQSCRETFLKYCSVKWIPKKL
jgi:hypothetical protein